MDGWMDEFQVVIDGQERAIVGFHRIKSSRNIHVPSRGVFGIFSLLFVHFNVRMKSCPMNSVGLLDDPERTFRINTLYKLLKP
jgi:hypothetical protein